MHRLNLGGFGGIVRDHVDVIDAAYNLARKNYYIAFLEVGQSAIYLGHLVGYIDYAFIEDDDFGDEFMACVASHDILISHNHVYYCLGRSAREAFFRAYYLRQACEVQIKAMSMVGGDIDRLRLVNSERETGYRDAMYTSEDYNYDGKTNGRECCAGSTNTDPTTSARTIGDRLRES